MGVETWQGSVVRQDKGPSSLRLANRNIASKKMAGTVAPLFRACRTSVHGATVGAINKPPTHYLPWQLMQGMPASPQCMDVFCSEPAPHPGTGARLPWLCPCSSTTRALLGDFARWCCHPKKAPSIHSCLQTWGQPVKHVHWVGSVDIACAVPYKGS